MWHSWVAAASLAFALAATAVPFLRRLAKRTDFFDVPAPHKSHTTPIPYLGGAAIGAGSLAAFAFHHPSVGMVATAGAAMALGIVGLVDDRRGMNPPVKLIMEVLCALAVCIPGAVYYSHGIGLHLGMGTAVAITAALAITVLAPNSFNLLDNCDGLAAGIAAAACAGIVALSVIRTDSALAVAAAAVGGACLGFLVFNWHPASIYMGDAGSLPLGLMIAVISLRSGSLLPSMRGAEITMMILAIPFVDTATVTLARLRHGRSVFQGGQDHLSHRLHAAGLSMGAATVALIIAELVLVASADMIAGDVLSPRWGALLTLAVLGCIVVPSIQRRVTHAIYGDKDCQPVCADRKDDVAAAHYAES